MNDSDSAATPAGSDLPGISRRRQLAIFLPLVIGGCLLDLLTKRWMFQWLLLPTDPASSTYWIMDGFFGFQTAVNQGALFGIGQGMTTLFVIVSLLAIALIVAWIVKGTPQSLMLAIALGLISAGILGNLYDRMGLWHAGLEVHESLQRGVRDWILFDFGFYKWPNFNLADSYLVCGAFLMVWEAFRAPSPANKKNN